MGLSVVLGVIAGVILLWGWVRVQEAWGIYYPVSLSQSELQNLPDDVELVTFDGESGRLSGFWLKGKTDSPVIVVFHGNAGHALQRIDWLRQITPDQWNGFVWDYRGYGYSEGTPSELGLYSDAERAVAFVVEKVGHEKLVLHGRSLGVPVAAHALQSITPMGIVLESGFPSARAMAQEILPVPGISLFLSVQFETVTYANKNHEKNEGVPKLVIHGRDDSVVPFALGKELFRRLPDPKESLFLNGVGHNDVMYRARDKYVRTLQTFYSRVARSE